MKTTLVLAVLLVASANAAIKRWKGPDSNYDNAKNWMGGSLPCAADTVTFAPTWSPSTVYMQSNMKVNSLTFPSDGTFVFVNALNITLGGTASPSCSGSNAIFTGQSPGNWDNPSNWETLDSTTNAVVSTATLAASDRLPCTSDTVRFPPSSSVAVRLNRAVQVNQFIINSQSLTKTGLLQYLTSSQGRGQFRLPSSSGITLGSACQAGQLCQCGNTAPDVLRSSCSYSSPSCTAVTGCLAPVTLAGDCCALCGGILNISSTALNRATLERELTTSIGNAPYRIQVVDSNTLQIMFIGTNGQTLATAMKEIINQAPTSFGLSSSVQIVTITSRDLPTTPPPTTELKPLPTVQTGCVQIVTNEEGQAVTRDGVEETVVIPVNEAQSSKSSTDNVAWYVVGAMGAFLVIILLVVIIILTLRKKDRKPNPNDLRNHPVHYVHHAQGAGQAPVRVDFGSDYQDMASSSGMDIYEDLKDIGGVTNPIYNDSDNAGLIQ